MGIKGIPVDLALDILNRKVIHGFILDVICLLSVTFSVALVASATLVGLVDCVGTPACSVDLPLA